MAVFPVRQPGENWPAQRQQKAVKLPKQGRAPVTGRGDNCPHFDRVAHKLPYILELIDL